MYEVLRELATKGQLAFNAYQVAQAIGRHPSQVQRDLDRLTTIGVIQPVRSASAGAAKTLRCKETRLAQTVIALPALIAKEIGHYDRAQRSVFSQRTSKPR